MLRHRDLRSPAGPTLAILVLTFGPGVWTLPLFAAGPEAGAQAVVETRAATPEEVLLQALASNPITAPYRFAVTRRAGGGYVLSGRVGTKVVHDAAIRTAIGLNIPVRDDLTIDTRAAILAAGAPLPPPVYPPRPWRAYPPYLYYPPPLFGRLDDPFLGFEPPLVTYPPWWGAVAAREPLRLGGAPATGAAAGAAAVPDVALPEGIVMSLDSRGVAVLRGRVPTLADRVAVGQKVAATPGITEVINLLEVGAAQADQDRPPPPPTPAPQPAPPPAAPRAAPPEPMGEQPNDAARSPIAADGDPLARRIADALARRPALGALPLRVSARDGVVTLRGRVPSAFEAMQVFRAAQQTPGVREVRDNTEFPLPDGRGTNPLLEKGRPEDVEPYLLAHVSKQLGDLAHVDQVKIHGDTLEIRGTVTREEDIPRVVAALRSTPLLRGARLEPNFVTD
jgi:hypothetical protein